MSEIKVCLDMHKGKTYILCLNVDTTNDSACVPVIKVEEAVGPDTEQRTAKDALGGIAQLGQEASAFLEVSKYLDAGRRLTHGVSRDN